MATRPPRAAAFTTTVAVIDVTAIVVITTTSRCTAAVAREVQVKHFNDLDLTMPTLQPQKQRRIR